MLSLSKKMTKVIFLLIFTDVVLFFGLEYDNNPLGVNAIKDFYFRIQRKVYTHASNSIRPAIIKFKQLDEEYIDFIKGQNSYQNLQKNMSTFSEEFSPEVLQKHKVFLFDNLQNKLENNKFQCHEKIYIY